MFDVCLDKDSLMSIDGTSEGTQQKYFDKGFWYKQDVANEGVVEYLVSEFMKFTTLSPDDYILYEYGTINGRNGCRSKSFTTPDLSLTTFEKFHQQVMRRKLSDVICEIDDMESKITYVLDFFQKYLGLNVFNYLRNIFTLDLIILNEDRHFNNLAFMTDETDPENFKYMCAPIFDNGKSLLNGCIGYKPVFSIEENVRRITAKPFSGDHKKMFGYFGKGFSVDVDSALRWLDSEPSSLYRDVLSYQIKRYRDILV